MTEYSTPLALASHLNGWNVLDIPNTWDTQTQLMFLPTDKKTNMLMHNTIRVLVEHGKSEIAMLWTPRSDEGVLCGSDYESSLSHIWYGPTEIFTWMTSEQRLDLLGDELEDFYVSLALSSCDFLDHDAACKELAVQKVSNPVRLAQAECLPWYRTVLHGFRRVHPPLHYPDPPKIPLEAIRKNIRAEADVHALDFQNQTPSMVLAYSGRSVVLDQLLTCTPEQNMAIVNYHEQLLTQWLPVLESEGYDLDEYFQREKELVAGRLIEVDSDWWAHEADDWHSLYYVKLEFETEPATGNLESNSYTVFSNAKSSNTR